MWVDALYEKVREDERVGSMAVVIATGVNLQGRREVLGLILLGHKLLAPQNGQHGSCRISQPVILSRMLAMEPALCLRACPRGCPAAGSPPAAPLLPA